MKIFQQGFWDFTEDYLENYMNTKIDEGKLEINNIKNIMKVGLSYVEKPANELIVNGKCFC